MPPTAKPALERPEADARPQSPARHGVKRNTALALGTQLTTGAFTAVLTLFLVRKLEPEGYGVFALALGIAGLVNIPSDLGVSPSAARFIAKRSGDPEAAAKVLSNALRLKLPIAMAVCGTLFACAGVIANAYETPELTWPLRGVAIALLGQNLMLLYGGAFAALRRISVSFRVVLAESAVECGASIALVLLGAGAVGAGFGRAIGYIFGATAAIVLSARVLGRAAVRLRGHDRAETRQLVGYAGALFIIDGAYTLFTKIDVLLIGAFLGATAVGVYQAPLRFTVFLTYMGLAAASGVAPLLANVGANPASKETFVAAVRYLVCFQAILIAPLVVWAEPIVSLLLGPGYEGSAAVLRALTPFIFLAGLAPLVSTTVNYLGEARRRIPIAFGLILINLVIDLLLIPRIGIVAGAIGTDVAYLLYVPAHLWVCKVLLGLNLRPVVSALLRALVACAAMAATLAAFGTSTLSVSDWFFGGLAGAIVYVATLIGLRAITVTELKDAVHLVKRRLRRGNA